MGVAGEGGQGLQVARTRVLIYTACTVLARIDDIPPVPPRNMYAHTERDQAPLSRDTVMYTKPMYGLCHLSALHPPTQVRGELQAALEARMPERNWGFITKQIGMFSFTGMTPAQVRDVIPWGSKGWGCPPAAPMHLPRGSGHHLAPLLEGGRMGC